jgi:hypothetical protein
MQTASCPDDSPGLRALLASHYDAPDAFPPEDGEDIWQCPACGEPLLLTRDGKLARGSRCSCSVAAIRAAAAWKPRAPDSSIGTEDGKLSVAQPYGNLSVAQAHARLSVALPTRTTGDRLPYMTDPDEIEAVTLSRWGVSRSSWGWFPCVLPGHRGPARIQLDRRDGTARYACRCRCCCAGRCTCRPHWRALAHVAAAIAAGAPEPPSLSPMAVALWTARMRHESGVERCEPVPIDAPDALANRYAEFIDGFGLALGLRRLLLGGPQPAPIAREFMGDWCGMSHKRARTASEKLIAAGSIIVVPRGHTYGLRELRFAAPGNLSEPQNVVMDEVAAAHLAAIVESAERNESRLVRPPM